MFDKLSVIFVMYDYPSKLQTANLQNKNLSSVKNLLKIAQYYDYVQ